MIKTALAQHGVHYLRVSEYRDFRPGDVRHSLADIRKAKSMLGYAPSHKVSEGIEIAMKWYVNKFLS